MDVVEIGFYKCNDFACDARWPCVPLVGEDVRLYGKDYVVVRRSWGTMIDGSGQPLLDEAYVSVELESKGVTGRDDHA
jgi:hypothetical protein